MINSGLTLEDQWIIDVFHDILTEKYGPSSDFFKNQDEIQWEYILNKLLEQKVFLLYIPYLKHIENSDIIYKIQTIKARLYNNIFTKLRISHKINKLIEEQNYICFISKGAVLSKIIYDTEYKRQFSDVDIYVPDDQINDVCNLLEKTGYEEINISLVSGFNDITLDNKKDYYNSNCEKQFIIDNVLVEIKKTSHYIEKNISSEAKNYYSYINTSIGDISCFNLVGSFMVLTGTIIDNFATEWGIQSSFYLRDIIDYYKFIIKYTYIFNDDLIKFFSNTYMNCHLEFCMSLLKDYLTNEELLQIPQNLLSYKSPKDPGTFYVHWGNTISPIARLLHPDLRFKYYLLSCYNDIVKYKQFELIKINYNSNKKDNWYTIYVNDIVKCTLKKRMLFTTNLYNDTIKCKFLIPDIYEKYNLELSLLRNLESYKNKFADKFFCDINNEIIKRQLTDFEGSLWEIKKCEKYSVITANIPINELHIINIDNKKYCLLYFMIFFPNINATYGPILGRLGGVYYPIGFLLNEE